VSAGYNFGPPLASLAQASVEMTGSIARESAKQISRIMEGSLENTKTFHTEKGGQMWQWGFITFDACNPDADNTIYFTDLVRTASRAEAPCCPVGYAAVLEKQHGACNPAHFCTCSATVCDASLPGFFHSLPNMMMLVPMLLMLLIMITFAISRLRRRLPLFLG